MRFLCVQGQDLPCHFAFRDDQSRWMSVSPKPRSARILPLGGGSCLRRTRHGKLVAVTATGGASSWRFEFVDYLKDKRVIILPDTDEAGQRYQECVAASLTKAGIPFQIADFYGYGNDVRDYLKDHTEEELIGFIDECGWLLAPVPITI